MDIRQAERQVAEWAEKHCGTLGLRGPIVKADYIWNPGGFVNQSFRITDGELSRHIKLANERKAPRLERWVSVSEYLSANYHAPRLVQEVREELIPGYGYGLVFEFIEGKPASSCANPAPVISEVMKTLKRLHSDTRMKAAIAANKARTYEDAFVDEYIARFEEDLRFIEAQQHLPSFVSQGALHWFASEVEHVRRLAGQHPGFRKPAADATHNDLYWQNILMNDNNDFWIIDWDDLTGSGDAAMDYSVLLWPLYQSDQWPVWKDRVLDLAGEEVLDRMELYFRAKLLDGVIDVLADYFEAESVPEVKERSQKRARDIHLRAYAEYMRLYVK